MEEELRIFDTNVIIHDLKCLLSYPCNGVEKHIEIPQPVINELDRRKKETSMVGYAARDFFRQLDKLKNEHEKATPLDSPLRDKNGVLSFEKGIPLSLIAGKSKNKYGRLYLSKVVTPQEPVSGPDNNEPAPSGDSQVIANAPELSVKDQIIALLDDDNRGDGKIIAAVIEAKEDERFAGMKIIFVTNDNGCSFNAANYLGYEGIKVEPYKKNRIEKPFDALFDYKLWISNKKWNSLFEKAAKMGLMTVPVVEEGAEGKKAKRKNSEVKEGMIYTLPIGGMKVLFNQHVIADIGNNKTIHGIVKAIDTKAKTFSFSVLKDYKKNKIFMFNALDDDQNFALNILLDPDIHLVTLLGKAGSGKTLLALIAAYSQILEEKRYNGVIVTREVMPASGSKDIGFLPGNMDDKFAPWMGLVSDNIEKINSVHYPETNATVIHTDKGEQPYDGKLDKVTKLLPTLYVRGRSIEKRFIIAEESQNSTPEQMKTLITRSSEGTKFVVTGNTAQIDDPFLSAETCGLTHTTRLLGKQLFAMVYIEEVFRSPLAALAEEFL